MKRFDRKLELDHETVGVLTLDPVTNDDPTEICPLITRINCKTVSTPTCICPTGTTC